MRILTFAKMLKQAPTPRLARLYVRLCVLQEEITDPRLFLRDLLAALVMAELNDRDWLPLSAN